MDANREKLLLEGLDESQREAVVSTASPLLVVAGAGSGKTRVLTRRIAWREAVGSLEARHTLALTFTRKAAGELRTRLSQLGLGGDLTAGTFHAVALAQLRRRALDLDRRPPVLLDSKLRILAMAIEGGKSLRGGVGDDRGELIAEVAGEIEWAKARLITPEQYVDAASAARRRVEGLHFDDVAELFARYELLKRRRGAVDFDDLLVDLAADIRDDPEFAATQRWRFRHLFVDELQDANRGQLLLLNAWLGERSDLFAVGDASQAIYGWNGADPSGVTEFATRYPGATVLELDANYRSTNQVVTVASAVLPRSHARITSTPRGDGIAPDLEAFEDEVAEAEAVAAEIHRARGRGRRYSECAVLARTNNQLATIEAALADAGIPIAARGASGFLARPAVRSALRSIATSNQPARFSQWRRELTSPAAPLAKVGFSERDPDVDAIVASRDAADRLALAELATEYADLDPLPHGRGFLAFLRNGLGSDPAPVAEDAVDLLTFHRAKGLEWPVVFVTGLEDGFVPISRAFSEEALAEERRLLYVALSRAEDELHCSWARTRSFSGQRVERQPSPYIDEIEAARRKLTSRPKAPDDAARRALEESRRALGRL